MRSAPILGAPGLLWVRRSTVPIYEMVSRRTVGVICIWMMPTGTGRAGVYEEGTRVFDPRDYQQLRIREAPLPGFYTIDLVVHGDRRGWFKENYQAAKMDALGLPHFEIVQNNFSYNVERGVTRGLHAEPWEKFISVANGSVFAAWVYLRRGPSFGKVFTSELNPGRAVFVPRGVANGYQTLEEGTTYTYLVNAHWSPDAKYAAVHLFDPTLGIPWPIGEGEAIVSEKDRNNPLLANVAPMEF